MSYLSSEENKNISRRFSEMDLHDSYVCCVQIVRLWLSKLIFQHFISFNFHTLYRESQQEMFYQES